MGHPMYVYPISGQLAAELHPSPTAQKCNLCVRSSANNELYPKLRLMLRSELECKHIL